MKAALLAFGFIATTVAHTLDVKQGVAQLAHYQVAAMRSSLTFADPLHAWTTASVTLARAGRLVDHELLYLRGGGSGGYYPKLERERANHALALRLATRLLSCQLELAGTRPLLRLRGGGSGGYYPKLERERANHALALRLATRLCGRPMTW